ncbi:MAG TPA: right-handed parallel beta-helix repeat-containing protein [Chthoniobacterales bacterium]|nr:right-handed parallel beta-helix repeat-containing protein [Chthoniobacterales bacterium]
MTRVRLTGILAGVRKNALVLGAALLSLVYPAAAADYVVTHPNDEGAGSLRQAISDANARVGADRILFNIPAGGVQRINVGSNPLPAISDAVTIDGYTQPGARANSRAMGNDAVILIELRRTHSPSETDAENYDGIVLNGAACTIRGLAITGFTRGGGFKQIAKGVGILARGNGGHVIEGNFIGLAPDGSGTSGEQRTGNLIGVSAEAPGTRIGGVSPASRNVISGNIFYGVSVTQPATVEGNYIGTDPSGRTALRNSVGGMVLERGNLAGCVVGGVTSGAGNVISGNGGDGVRVFRASGVRVQGNRIGTTADGADALPNGQGIEIFDSSNNLIGDLEGKGANVIAFNRSYGVSVIGGSSLTGFGNRILSNRIHSNDDQTGFTPPRASRQINVNASNDLNDVDAGANNGQNFPIIIRRDLDPQASPGTTRGKLQGGLNSTPSRQFTLQFFYLGGDCELLGTTTVVTDPGGNALFTFPFSHPTQLVGGYFTATATDPDGNTSEFFPENGGVGLANISTRAFVGTGENIPIAGFIVRSQSEKNLLIRALGPSLNLQGGLADPKLQIFNANQTLVAENDDWASSNQDTRIRFTGLAPANEREAAVIVTLPSGNYTAQLRGADGGTGVALIEIYDLNDTITPTSGRLANISTRGFVGKNDDVLIAGVIALGNAAQRVIVRAIGPELTARGVAGALQDPTLELRDSSGNLVAENDNWRQNQAQEIPLDFHPRDERESVIVSSLPPGAYTAIVRGKSGTTGVALIEFYDLTN